MRLIDADAIPWQHNKDGDVVVYPDIIAEMPTIEAEPVKTLKQIPEACKNCSNHPSNGGTGICFCTLGGMKITL